MNSKYFVFAIVALLIVTSTPAMAFGGVITNPNKILKVGPLLSEIDYSLPADPVVAQSPAHSIMGNELSLAVADYTSFSADVHLTTGNDPGFSNQGIYMNYDRAVINNTHFRRGLLYLQDFTYYQNTMLSGVAGYATPTVLPCKLYAASCHNTKTHTAAENMYGGMNLLKAIAEFKATQSDPNPNSRLFEGNVTDISCPANPAVNGCPGLSWHIGSVAGPVYTPNWVGRGSLHRHDIAVYVQGQATKVGLDMTSHYDQYASHATSAHYVEQPAAASVISDGVYISSGPLKGYNTAPVINFSRSNNAACPGHASTTANCWDLYSYGFGFTGPALFADATFFNTADLSNEGNPGQYNNNSMDFVTNGVTYAKTVSGALTSAGKIDLYEMQNLPWINVYFTNTLWGVLTDVWTGYADVPTQGPTTLSGLFYTLLNVHLSCFPANVPGCTTGGVMSYGLYSNIDTPGGLTPMAQFNSVYDADITNQIYDSPTIVGPTQFTSPGKYTTWMLSYNGKPAPNQSPAMTIKTSAFNGFTTGGLGWTDFQKAISPTVLDNAPQSIVKGQKFTLKFDPFITFHDHVPMTSADYNFSLYVSDVALPPTLGSVNTPLAGILAGPSGLIATHIVDPQTIEIYVNSSTALNPLNIIVPVIPLHIFKYFNVNNAWSGASTFDTSFRYDQAILLANGCSSCTATNQGLVNSGTVPWLFGLPTLEIGTGPYMLRSWIGDPTDAGVLLANKNYFRANWAAAESLTQIKKGTTFTYNASIAEWTYDTVNCAASPDKVCQLGPSAVSAVVQHVNPAGNVVGSYPLACVTTLHVTTCTGPVSTLAGFGIGKAEMRVVATYTYLGLARTWVQYTGLHIHP